jgi:hypothetical protein
MTRRVSLPVLAVLLIVGIAVACSDPPADQNGAPKKVKVTLVVVLASEEGSTIDPRLKQVAEELRKRDKRLSSFKVQSITIRKLAENEKSVFKLVDQKSADVVVKQGADEDNRVDIAVTAPDQGEILYNAACGKYLPIVTRHHTKNRELLVVAVRVDPCQEK